MTSPIPHISICVCTYRRPELLRRLLAKISCQETGDSFTYSVVVADNDIEQTAKAVVAEFGTQMPCSVVYCVEKRRNIALVRNQAVAQARGSYIAFIDDDEFPTEHWLLNMFNGCSQAGVSGVLGPVVAHYDAEPPRWVRAGGFYERSRHSTGFKLRWTECRTGNVLLRRKVLEDLEGPFRAEFGSGGEDQDFFRRAMEKGNVFLWCDEAVVYEFVPSSRWKRRFMLKRALLRGRNSMRHKDSRHRSVLKSIVAVPIYFLSLPLFLVFGHHYFMRYLVKLTDHMGLLLGSLGFDPVRERPM
jgi:succinoglycan biosynthesis protein ExoM